MRAGISVGLVLAAYVFTAAPAFSAEPPPVEAYGKLPFMIAPRMSPDGTMVAAIVPSGGKLTVVIHHLDGKPPTVIPADDYVRYRLAVNRAIAEILGEIKGPLLQSLLSWKGLACDLPSSQALLFWIRETLPDQFHSVLARVKAYA